MLFFRKFKNFFVYPSYFLKEKSQLFVRKNIYLSDRAVAKINFLRFLRTKKEQPFGYSFFLRFFFLCLRRYFYISTNRFVIQII